jgi:hypothetical protein
MTESTVSAHYSIVKQAVTDKRLLIDNKRFDAFQNEVAEAMAEDKKRLFVRLGFSPAKTEREIRAYLGQGVNARFTPWWWIYKARYTEEEQRCKELMAAAVMAEHEFKEARGGSAFVTLTAADAYMLLGVP